MRTIFNVRHRTRLLARLGDLKLEQAPLWGTLTAHGMIVHLGDQLRMALGDHGCTLIPSIWHNPIFRAAFLYIPGPWEKGMPGPPEAFVTAPTSWDGDLATLRRLLDRLVTHASPGDWPDHPNLGRMSKRGWGVFTYRHFDHHLKQFAV